MRVREFIRSNIMGMIALFVALGGTAYAVDGPLPGQNQVGSEDIITGEVKSTDIADGRIFNVDLADDLITGQKMKDDTITGADIDEATLTVPDAALSENIARLNAGVQTFAGELGILGDLDVGGRLTTTNSVDLDLGDTEGLDVHQEASAAAANVPTIKGTLNNTSTSGQQLVAIIQNQSGTGASTPGSITETLLRLDNQEQDPVGQGLQFVANGPITTAIDAADPQIGAALNLGANDLVVNGLNLNFAELGCLDGGIDSGCITDGQVFSSDVANSTLTAEDIASVSRPVNLPVGSFLNATDAKAIDFTSGSDNDPDYALVNSHVTIAYDDGGGALTDSDKVGSSFVVPPDYIAGGLFEVRVTQGAATAANSEVIACEVSVNGAATSAPATQTLLNQTASQRAILLPSATYSAHDAVSVNCRQSNAAADDGVRIHGVEFRYTADQ